MRIGKAVAVAATTVALAMGAVACNDDDGSTGAANPPAASHSAAASALAKPTAQPGQGGSGTAKPAANGNRCRTDELKAEIQIEPPIGNNSSALLKLANVGNRTCDLTGYAGLGGLLADNSQLSLDTNRVPFPFPPTTQNLIKPGDNAFAGLKWAPCDKGDETCHVLAGLVVTPPDQTTQLTADLKGLDNRQVIQLTVSKAGITIGTLQPTVGVLFNS
ncbi:DUF4232 domain-containing protein [Kitasatospora sp. NPDC006697]|uniref:DUF4232 domain-containing protein n=1 Tax=Kitasatospora sp. NPDC006697 TaxID=3364020 RepID=UPI0036791CE6